MRSAFIAAALVLFAAAPAFAQTEMDAAERALRTEMAPAGVAVDRVSPNEIRVTMPSDITFDFNRADVRSDAGAALQISGDCPLGTVRDAGFIDKNQPPSR